MTRALKSHAQKEFQNGGGPSDNYISNVWAPEVR